MKRIILLLCLSIFISTATNAQSYLLSWADDTIGEEVAISGNPSDEEILFLANLTNESNDTDTIKVERIFIDLEMNAAHLLCWENCYPANQDSIFVSPLYVVLEPGETTPDLTFSGHYRPNGTTGNSTVKYTFFNVSDKDENVSVIVHYNTNLSDSEEVNETENPLVLYPNPASNKLHVEHSATMDKIQLVNLAGQIVIDKTTTEKKLELDTSGCNTGFYILRVFSSNRIITQKVQIE